MVALPPGGGRRAGYAGDILSGCTRRATPRGGERRRRLEEAGGVKSVSLTPPAATAGSPTGLSPASPSAPEKCPARLLGSRPPNKTPPGRTAAPPRAPRPAPAAAP